MCVGDSPWNYSSVAFTRVNRVMLVSLCAETMKPAFLKGKLTAVEGNASFCQVYPVCRKTGEGRAEFLRAWGAAFEQERAGGGGKGGGGEATQSVR